MALSEGTKIGPYEVIGLIGQGGMGEVWQARDTKLDRDVALKVLPEAFTQDPDRLARFEREAKVLASLKPPQHREHLRAGGGRGRQGAGPRTGRGADAGGSHQAGADSHR